MASPAPSTMLRMVPLPRFTGEDKRTARRDALITLHPEHHADVLKAAHHPDCKSKSTKAFARRVTREATDPSRANAISLLRSSSLRKPPRIMRTSESAKPENSRIFYRDFNESEYIWSNSAAASLVLISTPASGRRTRAAQCALMASIWLCTSAPKRPSDLGSIYIDFVMQPPASGQARIRSM